MGKVHVEKYFLDKFFLSMLKYITISWKTDAVIKLTFFVSQILKSFDLLNVTIYVSLIFKVFDHLVCYTRSI